MQPPSSPPWPQLAPRSAAASPAPPPPPTAVPTPELAPRRGAGGGACSGEEAVPQSDFEKLLYDAVHAALAPVAHLEKQHSARELERRLRDKIRRNIQILTHRESSSYEQAVTKFVDNTLCRVSQRPASRAWIPHVDWLTAFSVVVTAALGGPSAESCRAAGHVEAAIALWHKSNKVPAAPASAGGLPAKGAPPPPPPPGSPSGTDAAPPVPPLPPATEEPPPAGGPIPLPPPPPPEPEPAGRRAPTWAWLGDAAPPPQQPPAAPAAAPAAEQPPAEPASEREEEATASDGDDLEEEAASAFASFLQLPSPPSLSASDAAWDQEAVSSDRPPTAGPPPSDGPLTVGPPLGAPEEATDAEGSGGAGAVVAAAPGGGKGGGKGGRSKGAAARGGGGASGAAAEGPGGEAAVPPQPLRPRVPWDDAVTIDKGCIQIQLAQWALDDGALSGWCQWAQSALPRLGGTGRSSDRSSDRGLPKPAHLALSLDLSRNFLTAAGLAELVHTLTRCLRDVRIRALKLHRNRLGAAAAGPLGQLLTYLGRKPREWRAAPEELHLSHNRLGLEGIMAVLESAAAAGEGAGQRPLPTYPLQLSGCTTARRPLWLRLEYNGQPERDLEDFILEASVRLAEIRRENGWLPEGSRAPMLCSGFYGNNPGCTAGACAKQVRNEGPIAHVNCWGGVRPNDLPGARAAGERPRSRRPLRAYAGECRPWQGGGSGQASGRPALAEPPRREASRGRVGICFAEDRANGKACPLGDACPRVHLDTTIQQHAWRYRRAHEAMQWRAGVVGEARGGEDSAA